MVTGIVCEYNPFHQGHAYHLAHSPGQLKVVILSHPFTQRGLPSLMSLENKTALAIEHGADIVCLLPATFACQSADYFARYAIESLSQLKITHLSFGSEQGDLSKLTLPQTNIRPETSLARNVQSGFGPNDILASRYVIECQSRHIQPYVIKRDPQFISATESRRRFLAGQPVEYAQKMAHYTWDKLYPLLKASLLLTPSSRLAQFHLMSEGIENHLKKAAVADNFDDFLTRAVTKTYSKARIQRTCVHCLLQTEKPPTHFDMALVVSSSPKGKSYLKQGFERVYVRQSDYPKWVKELLHQEQRLYSFAKKGR